MNAEIKAKWIEALKSGKYKKGKRALRSTGADGERFCCLGVLCEVLGLERAKYGYKQENGQNRTEYLSRSVIDRVELADQHRLAKLNDESETFDAVIEEIEKL